MSFSDVEEAVFFDRILALVALLVASLMVGFEFNTLWGGLAVSYAGLGILVGSRDGRRK